MSSPKQFRLPIGAKRQVTLPREFMDMLYLEEGGELLVETDGTHTTLTPMISVPRSALPEELRLRFESRRGKRTGDVPLAQFMQKLRDGERGHSALAAAKTPRIDNAQPAQQAGTSAAIHKLGTSSKNREKAESA